MKAHATAPPTSRRTGKQLDLPVSGMTHREKSTLPSVEISRQPHKK
jgi:hypothetical protein